MLRWQHLDYTGKPINIKSIYIYAPTGLPPERGTVRWDKRHGYVFTAEGHTQGFALPYQYRSNRVLVYTNLREEV